MVSTDQELVRCIGGGDRNAFAELYDRHAPRVLGLLVRLLRTRGDADDVLQEVFWQVWKTADRYDPDRGSPRVWLFLIARSRGLDFMRRRKPAALAEDQELATWESPSANIEQTETRSQVQQALRQLPESQRESITLAYYEGLAHQEISDRLQIPLGTAKTRIRLGMQRMRDLLAEASAANVQFAGEVTS